MYSISYCSPEQIEKCFFPVKPPSPLLYERQEIIRYTCIGKEVPPGEPGVFLGLKKDPRHFISNKDVYDAGKVALRNLSGKETSTFYASVNEQENEFSALITGATLIDVLEHQVRIYKDINGASQLVDLIDFAKLDNNLRVSESQFRKFLEVKLNNYFVGIIARNDYDLDGRARLYFAICQYVSSHELNILSLERCTRLYGPLDFQFARTLFGFVGYYYQLYQTEIHQAAIKPLLFDLHKYHLNPSAIEVDDVLLMQIKTFNQRVDKFLKGIQDFNYSLFLDFIINQRTIDNFHHGKEQWTKMSENYKLSTVYDRTIKRFEKILKDSNKRKSYERGTIEFFEKAWDSISINEQVVWTRDVG